MIPTRLGPWLAGAGVLAAAATAAVLPRPSVSPSSRAAPDVAAPAGHAGAKAPLGTAAAALVSAPAPLPGGWFAVANGDRVHALLREGDTVWAATEGGGVVRWALADGGFRQFLAPQDGLPSSEVRALARDREGVLWAATARGLARWDPAAEAWRAAAGPEGAGSSATALAATPDGGLWVGFEQRWDASAAPPEGATTPGAFVGGGLARLNLVTGRWGAWIHAEEDPANGWRTVGSDNVTALAVAGDGKLWIGTRPFMAWRSEHCPAEGCSDAWASTGGGLAATDLASGQWARWGGDNSATCTSDTVEALAADRAATQGRIWVATHGDGLQAFSDGLATDACGKGHAVFKRTSGGQALPGTKIWSVTIGDDGRVYAGVGSDRGQGGGQGVAVLDYHGSPAVETDDVWTSIGLDGVVGPVDPLVSALVVAGGELLAGTVDSRDTRGADGFGIKWRGADGRWRTFATAASGPPSNKVAALAVQPGSGQLWLGTAGRGVARWDGARWTTWRAFGRERVGATLAVTSPQRADTLVLATDLAGYGAAFPGRRVAVRLGLDDPVLYELYDPFASGNTVQVHVFPPPQAGYPPGAPVYTVTRGPAGDLVTALAFGADGRVWLGARSGLAKTPNPAFGDPECSDAPESCRWDGGLGAFDGTSWTAWQPGTSGLPSREVQAVAVDSRGQVWAGTGGAFGEAGRGVAVLDPASGRWTVHSRATAGEGFGFDSVSGVVVDPVTGHIWLASQGKPTCPTPAAQRDDCPGVAGAITRYDGSRWTTWAHRGQPPAPNLAELGAYSALAYDRGRARVWAGGWAGEPDFHWNDGHGIHAVVVGCPRSCTASAWSEARWPDEGSVYALAVDEAGRLWSGGHRNGRGQVPPVGGLRILSGDDWSVHTTATTPLPSDELTALAPAGAAMWVGTLARGAIQWRPAVLGEHAYLPVSKK